MPIVTCATQPNSQPNDVAIRTKMCVCVCVCTCVCVCVYMFVFVCVHDTETCLYLLINLYVCGFWSILGLYKLKQSTNPLPLEECGLAWKNEHDAVVKNLIILREMCIHFHLLQKWWVLVIKLCVFIRQFCDHSPLWWSQKSFENKNKVLKTKIKTAMVSYDEGNWTLTIVCNSSH